MLGQAWWVGPELLAEANETKAWGPEGPALSFVLKDLCPTSKLSIWMGVEFQAFNSLPFPLCPKVRVGGGDH